MPSLNLKRLRGDEGTSANAATLELGGARCDLPTKFPTSTELSASRRAEFEGTIPSGLIVVSKLLYLDSFKRVVEEDGAFKAYLRGISRKRYGEGNIALLFMEFKGVVPEGVEEWKVLMDLQFLSDFDIITVQQAEGQSDDDFLSFVRFSKRWMEERGVDKPLMPVICAKKDRGAAQGLLGSLTGLGLDCLGVDMCGGFYYHTLSAIEELKKSSPELWVHAFQVPPKLRLGGRLLSCAEGMVLPIFGIDSFSRWIVPPPPVQLTKDKINVFDREGWGFMKRGEWIKERGGKLNCDCPICMGTDVDGLLSGTIIKALSRGKLHDHFSQREEMEGARRRILEGDYRDFLLSKRGPKEFLEELGRAERAR
ncbi:MAG: hypothetical protein QW371_01400 [Candidatus Bathyarchaeia archaeon]